MIQAMNKKLTMAAKNTHTRALAPWIPKISNHLYWSALTGTSIDNTRDRVLSILSHVVDKHEDMPYPTYPTCEHVRPLPHADDIEWLEEGEDIDRATSLLFTSYMLTVGVTVVVLEQWFLRYI